MNSRDKKERRTIKCTLIGLILVLGSLLSFAKSQEIKGESLISGKVTLVVNTQGMSVSLSRKAGSAIDFRTSEPLCLNLLDNSGSTTWLIGGYSSIVRSGTSLLCTGEIRTPSGSVFRFADIYSLTNTNNSYLLTRQVTLLTPSTNDVGFMSRFSLRSSSSLRENDFFIPGIWYMDNSYVSSRALAANLSDDYFIIREDRMPLPLVMMRNKHNEATITLIHSEPDGSNCLADYEAGRVIDGRIQVASLGVFSQENTAVALYYPATEGERSYIRIPGQRRGRNKPQPKRWVERFHPVQAGVRHTYKVLINLSEQFDFPKAMRHAWRAAYEDIHSQVVETDIQASYEASIKLIADWSKTTKGAPGIPFRLRLPQGELEDAEKINYQMGFVGQQLPLAYHLLRYGLLYENEEIVRKGEAMVDFWAANSLTPEGLPRTWYNTYPQPHWRRYNTYMRIASDGMVGALMAWDVMQKYGHSKPEWIKFCKGFGDWLIKYQNPDGSWYREYNWDSKPINKGKQNTTHPIRFLIDLSKATGQKKYLDVALRAGEYCYPNVHQSFAYVGGTAGNPNVLDKEAGFMAMDAFLALWDVTGEQRWIEAASQAGDFTETWVYSWNIPIPEEDTAATYPKDCTTTGFSLIATGHSGADLFMAGGPFFFYRLYLGTGDKHYADMARQLLYDTKQGMDIDGSLGYGHTGLCTEALSLAPPRGHGVNTWLPWLTYSMIEPIVKLQEAYGMMDTPTVEGAKLEELRKWDKEFGKTRGLFTGKTKLRLDTKKKAEVNP